MSNNGPNLAQQPSGHSLTPVEHALAAFLANNDVGMVTITLTAIINILKNIISNPKDEKLRKLQKTNKNILYKITHPPCCRELMSSIGWTSSNDAYVLPHNVPIGHMISTIKRLEVQLEAAERVIAEIPRLPCHLPKESDVAVPIVGSARFEICIGSAMGRRPTMEDEIVVVGMGPASNPNEDFFGVFDGHGGREAAIYAAKNLYPKIGRNFSLNPNEPLKSITTAFEETNSWMLLQKMDAGTTAAVSYVVDSTLYTANVGDTRCVLGWRDRKAVRLSFDHKPSVSSEKERIERLGGEVTKRFGIARVNGVLGVSRAFGDYRLYPFVSAVPHINILELNEDTMFLIIACDGFWDEFTDQEAVELVFEKASTVQNVGEYLSNMAIVRGSQDNVSVIVVFLNPRASLYEEEEEEEDEEDEVDTTSSEEVSPQDDDYSSTEEERSKDAINLAMQSSLHQQMSSAKISLTPQRATHSQESVSSPASSSKLPISRPSMRAMVIQEDESDDSESDEDGPPQSGLGVGVSAWMEDDSE